ncbi:MAG TPA: hypothetical protein VF407_23440, partial [Polyangiaceae bacterium]
MAALPSAAHAQNKQPQQLLPPATTPSNPSDTDLTNTPPPPAMPVPEVSDPMLTAPADAAKKVQSWNEAISLVRSRSPDYLGSYETIRRAE